MSANSALNFVGLDFPADGSVQGKLGYAVKCATLANPMDEWQPWQFRVADGHVELFAHAGRAARTDDSLERELTIRTGKALLHLKLVLGHFGCLGRVELFPDLAQPGMVARVHYGSSRPSGGHDTAMFEALARSHESPAAANEPPLDESFLAVLEDNLSGEKAWLEFSQCESSRSRLVALAEARAGTSRVALQRAAPAESLKVAQWARPLLTFVVRSSDSGKFTVGTGGRRADDLAALAVIKTKTDDKHGWLATGLTLARARLEALASNISAHAFEQAFRDWRVREELRTSIGHKGFVQAIIGFGLRSAQWPDRQMTDQDHDFGPDADFPPRARFR